ncbi:MAG: hypothetical protein OEY86_14860 [Nitrospira sp.]|nr:hypothetical protein [Nitrospira sp.]
MNNNVIVKHAGSVISAIALLSLLGSSLNLGYVAENLVANYKHVRELVWSPISVFVSVPPRLKDILTFWCVFIPAFILRGHTHNNIAAISFIGSSIHVLFVALIWAVAYGIENVTGFFTWANWVMDSEDSGLLSQVFVFGLYSTILLPLSMSVAGVLCGWVYWWLVFLFPHLGVAIQLLALRLNSDIFEFIRRYFILSPYAVGCWVLDLAGYRSKIFIEPLKLYEQEPQWMSLEELKKYYLPVREVFVVFFALLLLSKVVFDSSG